MIWKFVYFFFLNFSPLRLQKNKPWGWATNKSWFVLTRSRFLCSFLFFLQHPLMLHFEIMAAWKKLRRHGTLVAANPWCGFLSQPGFVVAVRCLMHFWIGWILWYFCYFGGRFSTKKRTCSWLIFAEACLVALLEGLIPRSTFKGCDSYVCPFICMEGDGQNETPTATLQQLLKTKVLLRWTKTCRKSIFHVLLKCFFRHR